MAWGGRELRAGQVRQGTHKPPGGGHAPAGYQARAQQAAGGYPVPSHTVSPVHTAGWRGPVTAAPAATVAPSQCHVVVSRGPAARLWGHHHNHGRRSCGISPPPPPPPLSLPAAPLPGRLTSTSTLLDLSVSRERCRPCIVRPAPGCVEARSRLSSSMRTCGHAATRAHAASMRVRGHG